jgi:hypothetical protein
MQILANLPAELIRPWQFGALLHHKDARSGACQTAKISLS